MNRYLILPTLKSYLCGKRRLNSNCHYMLVRPNDLCAALNYQSIAIQYHPKNEKEKEELIQIISFLNQKGRNVTVTEFTRIFDDDLLLELASKNYDFKVCLRYMLESFESTANLEMEYSLQEYQEIIKKVKYFKEKVEENCKTDEEKAMFVITQLASYIQYTSIDSDDLTPVSDFYASIGKGEAVCVGYAIAFWKVLTELQIPCHIMLGTVPCRGKNWGHAWNQVCINGAWYNIDLTWFSETHSIDHLLKDDQNFMNHVLNKANVREECPKTYPRERLNYFIEEMKKYPNYLEIYEKKRGISI